MTAHSVSIAANAAWTNTSDPLAFGFDCWFLLHSWPTFFWLLYRGEDASNSGDFEVRLHNNGGTVDVFMNGGAFVRNLSTSAITLDTPLWYMQWTFNSVSRWYMGPKDGIISLGEVDGTGDYRNTPLFSRMASAGRPILIGRREDDFNDIPTGCKVALPRLWVPTSNPSDADLMALATAKVDPLATGLVGAWDFGATSAAVPNFAGRGPVAMATPLGNWTGGGTLF